MVYESVDRTKQIRCVSVLVLAAGRFEEALLAYDRAVAAPPPAGQTDRGRAMLIAQRSMALSALARTAEAKAVAREALALDPAQPLASKIAAS